MAIENLPKRSEGKALLRGQVWGTVCRKKKSFGKVMTILFAQGCWEVLMNRAL